MSKQFDPYYEWLGIPPKDQPPNHYRLLGIEVFESNVNVIERAADRQMGHVRTFQAGKNSRASQELLNKLSAAKVCLLNSQRKAEYDQQLQATIAQAGGATTNAESEVDASPSHAEMPIVRVAPRNRRKSQPPNPVMIGVGVTIAIVVVIVMLVLLIPREPAAIPPNPSNTQTASATSTTTEQAAANSGAKPDNTTVPPGDNGKKNESIANTAKPTTPGSNDQSTEEKKPAEETKPAAEINLATIAGINEFDSAPQDPADSRWPDAEDATKQRISAAKGLVQEKFAFCQTMPLSEFAATLRELRVAGYRLVRARPYRADPQVQVAAVWHRDGLPFRAVVGGTRFEIENAQDSLSGQGFTPTDLSVCAINANTPPDEIFSAVWVRAKMATPSKLLIGLTKSVYDQQFAALEQQYFPHAVWRHAAGQDIRFSAILLNATPKPEYQVIGGIPSYYRNQLTKGMPIDVGQYREGNVVRLSGIILLGDKRRFAESHGMLPDNHLERCQGFADQGLQPLVITVSPGPNGRFQGASIWTESSVGSFPELALPAPAPTTVATTPPTPPAVEPTAPSSNKTPVPATDQAEAAAAKLREQLKTKLAASKTAVKQSVLSASLVASAREERDATAKYAQLTKARDLAIDAADVWAGIKALDLLGETYDADLWSLRLDLLEKVSQKAKTEGARKQLAEAALSFAHEASLEEKFDVAEKLIAFGRRAKDYVRLASARGKLLDQQKQLATKAAEARTKLNESPDDPAANLAYGRYLCFAKEDWVAGLSHLAKGSDAELAELAKKEIGRRATPADALAVAESWAAWGAKHATDENGLTWRHVQWLLRTALPDLPGFSKAKALEVARDCTTRMNQAGDVQRFGQGKDSTPGEIMRLYGHSGGVTSLASSRSGRWLVSGSRDDTLRVWDLTAAAELTRISTSASDISAFALFPDEERLVAVGQGTKVVTARLSAQSELGGFDAKSPVQDIVMSADGQRLLLTTYGAQWGVIACDTDGKRQVALPMKGTVKCTDLSRSGSFAAIADENNVVHIWDLRKGGEPTQLTGFSSYITDVAIAPNEELVAACFGDGIVIWNLVTGAEVNRVSLQRGAPQRAVFTLDSQRLIASSLTRDVSVIDVEQGTVTTTLEARPSPGAASACEAIAVSPDGHGAATAGIDGVIFVWRLPD